MCKIFLSSPFLFRYFFYSGSDKGECPIIYSFFVRIAAVIILLLFNSSYLTSESRIDVLMYVDIHKHRGSEIRHKLSVLFKLLCDMMTVTCG